ncbi:hypothetical protein C8R44DRAFT_954803 [Mycena epipterygia]|nr:hypothetical protein C8R44DRAFT_954803 [Mycena epipterygia]
MACQYIQPNCDAVQLVDAVYPAMLVNPPPDCSCIDALASEQLREANGAEYPAHQREATELAGGTQSPACEPKLHGNKVEIMDGADDSTCVVLGRCPCSSWFGIKIFCQLTSGLRERIQRQRSDDIDRTALKQHWINQKELRYAPEHRIRVSHPNFTQARIELAENRNNLILLDQREIWPYERGKPLAPDQAQNLNVWRERKTTAANPVKHLLNNSNQPSKQVNDTVLTWRGSSCSESESSSSGILSKARGPEPAAHNWLLGTLAVCNELKAPVAEETM